MSGVEDTAVTVNGGVVAPTQNGETPIENSAVAATTTVSNNVSNNGATAQPTTTNNNPEVALDSLAAAAADDEKGGEEEAEEPEPEEEEEVAKPAVAKEEPKVTTNEPPTQHPEEGIAEEPEEEEEQETYVYRDFATIPAPPPIRNDNGPQSMQAQKLPAKLATMLCDHELTAVITWLPHGRSWKVLNRDLFADHALPRYFGHKNYASFVRIVNAWGFRRITRGADRDSYYHELFLRGRPDLHHRMKRLGTMHRKTPIHKEDKCPDFYDLSKTSPLPEITYQRFGQAVAAHPPPFTARHPAMSHVYPQAVPSSSNFGSSMNGSRSSVHPFSSYQQQIGGMPSTASYSYLGGQVGHIKEENVAASAAATSASPGNNDDRLAQLQRDNDDLKRRIADMEARQRASEATARASIPSYETSNGSDALLDRMRQEIMMRGSASNGGGGGHSPFFDNSLISSYGHHHHHGHSSLGGGGGGSTTHDEMILRALQEQADRHHSSPPRPSHEASPSHPSYDEERRRILLDMLARQQKREGPY